MRAAARQPGACLLDADCDAGAVEPELLLGRRDADRLPQPPFGLSVAGLVHSLNIPEGGLT